MHEPKINEVWATKNGNLAIIVDSETDEGTELAMLWFDWIDRSLTVSKLYNRLLSHKTDRNAKEVFISWWGN